jgi:hypothetical protein
MRIGLDFDNTIVSYDALFHQVAVDRNMIPRDLPASKVQVRDYLRRVDREQVWTEMQGEIYGAQMHRAEACPGVVAFLQWAADSGHAAVIVSHKTQRPIEGPAYDLHGAARKWMKDNLRDESRALMKLSDVYFELTICDKLARVASLDLDCFIDDLPEVLLSDAFPSATRGVLYDPEQRNAENYKGVALPSWCDIQSYLKNYV